jgi:restriction endonuclease Mrr
VRSAHIDFTRHRRRPCDPQKVILLDGPRLAELMLEYNLGVFTLLLKRIDSDYL